MWSTKLVTLNLSFLKSLKNLQIFKMHILRVIIVHKCYFQNFRSTACLRKAKDRLYSLLCNVFTPKSVFYKLLIIVESFYKKRPLFLPLHKLCFRRGKNIRIFIMFIAICIYWKRSNKIRFFFFCFIQKPCFLRTRWTVAYDKIAKHITLNMLRPAGCNALIIENLFFCSKKISFFVFLQNIKTLYNSNNQNTFW